MNINFELYKTMFTIREAEKIIQEYYVEDEMKTPMHMSMGEEAIVAGVVGALKEEDQVFGTYRSHALYLAKTGDVDGFFAELYGKETGHAKGKAGSMHLNYPEKGMMATSAIVATTIPVAIGAALANLYQGNNKKVAVFFGDGAVDEGSFWESLNFACLKKLPIIFVYEDNDLAIHTFKKERQGHKDMFDIVSKFYILATKIKTVHVETIFTVTKELLKQQEEGINCKGPIFIELFYYRYLEHVGVNTDFQVGYRQDESGLIQDPVSFQRELLLQSFLSEDEIKKVENEIIKRINQAVKKAKEAPFADKKELFKGVYA